MTVDDSYKYYYSALQKTLPDHQNVALVDKKQYFQYCKLSFSSFSEEYRSEGWIAAKFAAIPCACWQLTAVVCYRVACIVFNGIPRAVFGNPQPIKQCVFTFVRDLEEAFGRILSLFHHKSGLYFIQDSQFHKSCYHQYEKAQITDKQKKSIDHLIVSNKFEQALTKAKTFSGSTTQKDELCEKIVEGFLSDKLLEKALNAIGQLSSENNRKDQLFEKVATAYYEKVDDKNTDIEKQAELRECLVVIEKIKHKYEIKEGLLLKLSEKHLELGDARKSKDAVMKIVHNTEKKEELLAKITDKFLDTNEQAMAAETSLLIEHNQKLKESTLIKSAEEYLKNKKGFNGLYRNDKFFEQAAKLFIAQKKYDDALELIERLYEKADLLMKLAEEHLGQNDVDNFIKVINPAGNSERKEMLLQNAIDSFLKSGNPESALKVIKIIKNEEVKEKSIVRVVDAYSQSGELQKATDVIRSNKLTEDTVRDLHTKLTFQAHRSKQESLRDYHIESLISFLITDSDLKNYKFYKNKDLIEKIRSYYIFYQYNFISKIRSKYTVEIIDILETGTPSDLTKFFQDILDRNEILDELIRALPID